MTVALPPLVASGRSDRVRSSWTEVDGLLVTDLVNVRWLSGFTGSNGWLLVLPDRDVLVTDRRYGEQAGEQTAHAGVDVEVMVGASVGEMIELSAMAVSGLGALGVEAEHMTIADHRRWIATLAPALVPTTGIVERCRRSKDAAEITRIERAAAIAASALTDCAALLWSALAEKVTERDVRDELESRLRALGADGPGYETIVATGPHNASLPHHRPDHTALAEGHTVIIDVGAAIDGYRSDMTRTFVLGDPDSLQGEIYDLVRRSQAAGLAAVAPGVPCRELDAACRGVIAAAGWGDDFRHGTGHGVGLVIHEDPFVNASSDAVLQVGDVVTVEPGVYRDGVGGVRLEDLVVVTPDGCRNLTPLPKDSPCLPSPPTT